jgi:putative ABC transport system ATP-binding protein
MPYRPSRNEPLMTASERPPFVAAHDLHKSYPLPDSGRLTVLDGARFTLEAGSTLAVTGQSGSGKSTLIALLAGLDSPDKGKIAINGSELTGMSEAGLTRFRANHIGIVFQQFHLLPHLSAEENIRLPLELLARPCDDERIGTLLESIGLTARRNHLPAQLSGGECQRVAIARALAVQPLLLLADEPTGNLDVATGREISNLLFDLVERHQMTMLVVTHNQELAERCTRQLLLSEGLLH